MKNIFFALLCFNIATAHAAPDVQRILQDSDQARGGGLPGIVWQIDLTSRDGDKIAEPQVLQLKSANNDFVAEVQQPTRSKGTSLVQVGHNMWLTKPGLFKPIPISPRQRMSGQASNGDIAGTNYAGDYDAQLKDNEAIDGEDCYLLDLQANNKRATYDHIRYWVSVKRNVGVKAEFSSVSGKLLKTARFEYGNAITHDGKRSLFVSKVVIRDALIDAETTMVFSKIQVKKIAASEFDLGQIQ